MLLFEIRGDHAVLIGCEGTHEYLCIPASRHGVPVTGIEAFAFDGNKALRLLQLPASIRKIGTAAFRRCEALQCVTIEDIGQFPLPDTPAAQRFSNPNGYISFLPPALEHIGPEAFRATGLQRIIFSSKKLTVESSAFQLCSNLEKVTLHCREVHIHNHGFAACNNLTEFSAPFSHCVLDRFAFGNCRNLADFFVKETPDYAPDTFFACPKIQSLQQSSDWRFTIDPRMMYRIITPSTDQARKQEADPEINKSQEE